MKKLVLVFGASLVLANPVFAQSHGEKKSSDTSGGSKQETPKQVNDAPRNEPSSIATTGKVPD